MNINKIFRNIIQTPDGTLLESLHMKDVKHYVDTVDNNTYTVAGGRASLFRPNCNRKATVKTTGVKRLLRLLTLRGSTYEVPGYVELSIEADQATPHRFVRQNMRWGLLGKDSKKPEHFIVMKDMSDDLIKDLLTGVLDDLTRMWLEEELKYRGATETENQN
jgi:hypothetical protein